MDKNNGINDMDEVNDENIVLLRGLHKVSNEKIKWMLDQAGLIVL